ncbi:hypothetical protein ACSNN6_01160 [Brevibacillus formosus]
MATKEFVATVLYRMFGTTRPYHGGIDLKDSESVAVRWAVEVGFHFITLVLPGKKTDGGWEYDQVKLLDGMLSKVCWYNVK